MLELELELVDVADEVVVVLEVLLLVEVDVLCGIVEARRGQHDRQTQSATVREQGQPECVPLHVASGCFKGQRSQRQREGEAAAAGRR